MYMTKMLQLATPFENDEHTTENNETDKNNDLGIEQCGGIDFDCGETERIRNTNDLSENINETTDPGNKENIENTTYLVE